MAARVGLWMNPVNGGVCVCERERERYSNLWDHVVCGTVDKGGLSSTWRTWMWAHVCGTVDKGGLSSTWRTWMWAHGHLWALWNGGHAIVS